MNMVKTVCLDFDGVLAQYSVWNGLIGASIPEGAKLARMLKREGFKVVVQSCRTNRDLDKQRLNYDSIILWLRDHDIPFDELVVSGKALADVYVDDRGVNFPSNEGPAEMVFREILRVLGSTEAKL